jgi:hypothetical protein
VVKKVITTENDVKKLVKKVFDDAGAWSYAPIQTGMGAHGIPDRVGCVPVTITPEMVGQTFGLFVAVEAKRPGRRGEKNAGATGQQVEQLRGIIDAGGVAILADGEDDAAWLGAEIKRARDFDLAWATYWGTILNNRITGKDNG